MALDNRRPALDRAIGALRAQERRRRGGQALALRVMRGVRAETLPGPLLPLDDPTQDLRISGAAAAKVLRRAADTLSGVRAVGCRLTAAGDGSVAVHVVMTLSAALDHPLPDRAAQVRTAVLRAARLELGLAVLDVDLEIAEVLDPPGGGAR